MYRQDGLIELVNLTNEDMKNVLQCESCVLDELEVFDDDDNDYHVFVRLYFDKTQDSPNETLTHINGDVLLVCSFKYMDQHGCEHVVGVNFSSILSQKTMKRFPETRNVRINKKTVWKTINSKI